MSSISNPKIEKNIDDNDKNKSKKNKKKIDLFPPIKKRPEAPKISVEIENTCIFPKIGTLENIYKNT